MALLLRLIGFILCSLIYIFTISQDNYLTLTTEGIRNASVYFNAIMLFPYHEHRCFNHHRLYLFHLIKPEKFPFGGKNQIHDACHQYFGLDYDFCRSVS